MRRGMMLDERATLDPTIIAIVLAAKDPHTWPIRILHYSPVLISKMDHLFIKKNN